MLECYLVIDVITGKIVSYTDNWMELDDVSQWWGYNSEVTYWNTEMIEQTIHLQRKTGLFYLLSMFRLTWWCNKR